MFAAAGLKKLQSVRWGGKRGGCRVVFKGEHNFPRLLNDNAFDGNNDY